MSSFGFGGTNSRADMQLDIEKKCSVCRGLEAYFDFGCRGSEALGRPGPKPRADFRNAPGAQLEARWADVEKGPYKEWFWGT